MPAQPCCCGIGIGFVAAKTKVCFGGDTICNEQLMYAKTPNWFCLHCALSWFEASYMWAWFTVLLSLFIIVDVVVSMVAALSYVFQVPEELCPKGCYGHYNNIQWATVHISSVFIWSAAAAERLRVPQWLPPQSNETGNQCFTLTPDKSTELWDQTACAPCSIAHRHLHY